MTLEPADIIVTGTPSNVGPAQKPPSWMKPDAVCEVELDGICLPSEFSHGPVPAANALDDCAQS